jgi:hypothetical protein
VKRRFGHVIDYNLVGTNAMRQYKADMGGVLVNLGIGQDVNSYAREIGRVEHRLLWAHKQGLEFPPTSSRRCGRASTSTGSESSAGSSSPERRSGVAGPGAGVDEPEPAVQAGGPVLTLTVSPTGSMPSPASACRVRAMR